ncbi:protein MAIN-LIKE 1-like [Amaranthus tricolor]|uniref:protein MAIN-LIKE 1-like n=1 Tax=Amaranthus tricolor TaxID=29722 RepID=UPI0025837C9C|nr:protein MAIN-LIKE 1-like [Amaranthus tricolor]
MACNQGKGKGLFRQLLRGSSFRPTLLRGDPHERGVTGFAKRARQEEAARHSIAQRSSALDLVRTPLDDQSSSIQSSWGVSSDDDNDADDVQYEAPDSRPLDWTVVRGPEGRFAHGGSSSSAASERAGRSFVDNEPPRESRSSQSANTDWLVTSPQPRGPTDTQLIPSYGGHITKLIFDGSERTPPILDCRIRKRLVESIIRLRDMSDAFNDVLPTTSLGRLPDIMHQHIDCALISAFVEGWQPDTNTVHMLWGEMTIMLHDVQRILGISIEGFLSAEPSKAEWHVGITNLFGEPMSELRRRGAFTCGSVNVAELMRLCHRSQAMDTQTTAYYMAIVGSTLLAYKTRIGMPPHLILAVNVDQQEVAWGAVTLAYLYRQLGMASRAGCKTIVGCLTLLQTWIY